MSDFLKKIIPPTTREETEKMISQYLDSEKSFCHVVSINPEIVMEARRDSEFEKAITSAHVRILDGVGVFFAGKFLGIDTGQRFTGVELMEFLLKEASVRRSRVLLLGGRSKVAEKVVECQVRGGSMAIFRASRGFLDKNNPLKSEEKEIESIIATFKPQIILVSFGSPFQEKWIHRQQASLGNSVCSGVGGAFDFLSGEVRRAPGVVRFFGLEWLFRLLLQPWRIKRQTKLIKFVFYVIKEKFF